MAPSDNSRRQFERARLRVPCELHLPDRRHTGFVVDVSASGLFVQTSAKPELGIEFRLVMRDPETGEDMELVARVAREHGSHRGVSAVRAKGIGLELKAAPPSFYAHLIDLSS